MKEKIQKNIIPIVILFVVLFAENGSAITIEPSQGVENRVKTGLGIKYWSEVYVPGHAVFEYGANSGFQTFPLYFLGEHYYFWSIYTKITQIVFAIRAKYRETMSQQGETVSTNEYWDAPPIDLITYGGSRKFNSEVASTYSYSAQVQGSLKIFQMQIGVSSSSNPTCYTSVSGDLVDNGFRTLGWIDIRYTSRYIFTVMIPLTIHNFEANNWYNGVVELIPNGIIRTQIIGFEIKALYLFWRFDFSGGTYGQQYILGDNINVDYGDADINMINLRPGYAIG